MKALPEKLRIPHVVRAPLFCILLLSPSLVWLARDHTPWSWDQAHYADTTLNCWFAMISELFNYLFLFSYTVISSRPPGLALTGQLFVPLGILTGSMDFCLMLAVALHLGLTFALLIAIGRSLQPKNRFVPYLAVLLIASTPQFIDLSRNYLVEPMQMLSSAYFFWILATLHERRGDRNIAHLIFASCVCLLSKASSPIYCIIPGLVATVKVVVFQGKQLLPQSKGSALILSLGFLALGMVSLWYLQNLFSVWLVVKNASFGAPALNFGEEAPFMVKLRDWSWNLLISWTLEQTRWPILILLAVPGFGFLKGLKELLAAREPENTAALEPPTQAGRATSATTLFACAIAQILLVLTTLSLNIGSDPRYGFALLPAVAIAFMVLCANFTWKIYYGALAIVLFYQYATLHAAGIRDQTPQNIAKQNLEEQELEALASLVASNNAAGYPVFIGLSYKWLNCDTVTYYVLKQQIRGLPGGKCKCWGYAQGEKAIKKKLDKLGKYVLITMEPTAMSRQTDAPFANTVNASLRAYVVERGSKIDHPSRFGVELFKVDKPPLENRVE